jgi:Zn-dependent protease with chaperone function
MSPDQQRAVMGALGAGAKFGVLMPFSRDLETQADERGLLYAARAGYNPQEAVAFRERMYQAGGGQPPELMVINQLLEGRLIIPGSGRTCSCGQTECCFSTVGLRHAFLAGTQPRGWLPPPP